MLNPEHDACNEMLAPDKGSPHGLNPREKRVGLGEAPLRCATGGAKEFLPFLGSPL